MSFDEKILLSIKRQYSGDEKFKLFLRHLDNVESELRLERAKNTDLLKRLQALTEEFNILQVTLSEYTATSTTKKFVNVKSHNKQVQLKVEWEARYWELHHAHDELVKQLNTIHL